MDYWSVIIICLYEIQSITVLPLNWLLCEYTFSVQHSPKGHHEGYSYGSVPVSADKGLLLQSYSSSEHMCCCFLSKMTIKHFALHSHRTKCSIMWYWSATSEKPYPFFSRHRAAWCVVKKVPTRTSYLWSSNRSYFAPAQILCQIQRKSAPCTVISSHAKGIAEIYPNNNGWETKA